MTFEASKVSSGKPGNIESESGGSKSFEDLFESESGGSPVDIVCEEGVQDREEEGGSFARA